MPANSWNVKFEVAKDEISNLVSRLFKLARMPESITQEKAKYKKNKGGCKNGFNYF